MVVIKRVSWYRNNDPYLLRHIAKNYCKDVAEHYPNMPSEQQTLLKKMFVGMFDIIDLQKLRTICEHFSTILLSRYSDENVRLSLTELATVITSAKKFLMNLTMMWMM